MSEADRPPPQSRKIHSLDYRDDASSPRSVPARWPVAAGVILAVGGLGFLGLIGGVSVFDSTYRYPPSVSRAPQPSPAASYAVWYLILTMMMVLVFVGLPRGRRRGFVLGLLIGTAVTGLVEGLCFLNW